MGALKFQGGSLGDRSRSVSRNRSRRTAGEVLHDTGYKFQVPAHQDSGVRTYLERRDRRPEPVDRNPSEPPAKIGASPVRDCVGVFEKLVVTSCATGAARAKRRYDHSQDTNRDGFAEPVAAADFVVRGGVVMRENVLSTHRLLQTVGRPSGRRIRIRAGYPTSVVE